MRNMFLKIRIGGRKMEQIKYISNNPVKGIKYNWKKIIKLYKSLKIPREYDYTEIVPFDNDKLKWYNLNSERSVGKTTNILLIGMCMNKLYGTQIQLVRHTIAKASYYKELFNTIVGYNGGQYILALTDGKFNNVKYYQKRFYYTKTDEAGREIDKCEIPFCVSLAADDCYNLCSTYEAPKGDLIILDECFNDKNRAEEFVHFIHLHKTIVRERMSDKIFVLGNTLDVNNIWYRQMMIQNEVRKLKRGESKVVYTSKGMPIYVSFLDNRSPELRKEFNDAHYGWENPELNAIVGNGEWNVKMYPQTCELKDRKQLIRGIYFNYHDDLFLEGAFIEAASGKYFEVHPATQRAASKGDLQFVLHMPIEKNQLYYGQDMISKAIKKFIMRKRVVFSDNETGDLFDKFMSEVIGL